MVHGRVWEINQYATGSLSMRRLDVDLREHVAMRAATDLTKSSYANAVMLDRCCKITSLNRRVRYLGAKVGF